MPTVVQRAKHRAVTEYRGRVDRRLHAPSYTYKQSEAKRVRRRMRELGCEDPAYRVNPKDAAHAWARRLGLRTPELIGTWESPGEVPWDRMPEAFVVKPTRGTASKGVFLLQRQVDGWRDLRTGRRITLAMVEQELAGWALEGLISAETVVEELVVDPRFPDRGPIDYKVSTFYGEVGMIEAASHSWDEEGKAQSSWRIFSPDWRDLGNVFNDYLTDTTVPVPQHADALLDMARQISLAVPRPYLRVDLFDDESGPVFGEITPEPGGELCVRPDIDLELGQRWEEAEARLRARAVRAGLLDVADTSPSSAVHLGLTAGAALSS